MNASTYKDMTLQELSRHLYDHHWMSLPWACRLSLDTLQGGNKMQRTEALTLFLTFAANWSGPLADTIKEDLNRRLRTLEI